MPPGPVYNWTCVALSIVDIISNVAAIRAAQVYPKNGAAASLSRKRRRTEPAMSAESHLASRVATSSAGLEVTSGKEPSPSDAIPYQQIPVDAQPAPSFPRGAPQLDPAAASFISNTATPVAVSNLAPLVVTKDLSSFSSSVPPPKPRTPLETQETNTLISSKVPSSRLGRFFHYGGLAASLGYGAASEMMRRSTLSQDQAGRSMMLSEANVKRLVTKLSKMRGAALKLGQFMSIQDTHVLPPEVHAIFRRVQDSAHYMPDWQMEEVMQASFGHSWIGHFESFDRLPFAAASIGQVHRAVLNASSSPTGRSVPVAVKIQFPNIANSIESDLGYVKMLLTAGRLLPKGLFLDKTIQVMKQELADECDYEREASFLRKFGSDDFLGHDPRFKVPWVWDHSTKSVLVMERVDGSSVGGPAVHNLSQQDKDDIAARIIELCLKELFQFRAMQTDPNWTNFLWNSRTRQIELVDFGASREYSKKFIDKWLCLLQAAISGDRDACIEWSLKLGYLTGQENDIMVDAHVNSVTTIGIPFKRETSQPFAFGPGTAWADVTAQVRDYIPVMLKHRLTPPPRETYSLNRKLSGAFLLASRLDARVDCRALWDNVIGDH